MRPTHRKTGAKSRHTPPPSKPHLSGLAERSAEPERPAAPVRPTFARGLGRGLAALLPSVAPSLPTALSPIPKSEERREVATAPAAVAVGDVSESVVLLDVEQIRPSPHQPRERFDEKDLTELAASIASVGIIEPIIVRESKEGFELIAGERRWRAAQRLGWRRVPALVRNLADTEAVLRTLIENLQRADLSALEEARAYRMMIDDLGLTQEQVADRVAKDRTTVTNSLRLLKLPPGALTLLAEDRLSAGHARAVLAVEGETAQEEFAKRIVDEGWSVRQAETFVTTQRGRPPAERKARKRAGTPEAAPPNPEFEAMESEMRRSLGSKVRIVPRAGEAGVVEAEYYSQSDLDRIYRRLAGR